MIDYIIPLPPGTTSGGKIADGLFPCPNGPEKCGEVAVVRIMKTGEIAAYCDGKVTVRKCGARQFSGSVRDFPSRDKETALVAAYDLGLADAPQEYIDLFEKSWEASLTKVQNNEGNIPEIRTGSSAISETANPDNPENRTATPGTTPDNPAGEPGNPETSGQSAPSQPATSGLQRPDEGKIFEEMYGG